jgi:hypothetical protein
MIAVWTMKPDIITKLQSALAQDMTEAQVVYILVEIRKLLELENNPKRFRSLQFFCDWALHSRLDRAGALEIIKQFDDIRDAYVNGHKERHEALTTDILDLLNAQRFRTELASFLGEYSLDTSLCDDLDKWASFTDHYGSIIEDVFLEFNPYPIKYVKSVRVVKHRTPGLSGLEWQVFLLDGSDVIAYAADPPRC